jgi:hypothetical protein
MAGKPHRAIEARCLRRHTASVSIGVHLWWLFCSVDVVPGEDLLVRNARLIDGTGAAPRAGSPTGPLRQADSVQ